MKSNALRCDEFFDDRTFEKRGPFRWESFISTAKDFDVSFASVLQTAIQKCRHIAMDEEILGGTPRIAGTRIPVYMVLDAIQFYGHLDGARESYPQLSVEQVKEAVTFAGLVLEHPVEHES